jgi:hypothetical protein
MDMNSAQRRRVSRDFRKLQYSTLIDAKKHREAGEWCLKQFGKRWEAIGQTDGAWTMFWAGRDDRDKYIFHFVDEKDYVLFILRWV